MKETVSVRPQMTKDEYAKVKEHVESRGMKLQNWLRGAILAKYVSERQKMNTNIVLAPVPTGSESAQTPTESSESIDNKTQE